MKRLVFKMLVFVVMLSMLSFNLVGNDMVNLPPVFASNGPCLVSVEEADVMTQDDIREQIELCDSWMQEQ